jgi:hypothetical protein
VVDEARLGKIGPGVLEATAKLAPEDQHRIADRIIAGEKVSLTAIEDIKSVTRKGEQEALPGEIFESPPDDPIERAMAALRACRRHVKEIQDASLRSALDEHLDEFLTAFKREVRKREGLVAVPNVTPHEPGDDGSDPGSGEVDDAAEAADQPESSPVRETAKPYPGAGKHFKGQVGTISGIEVDIGGDDAWTRNDDTDRPRSGRYLVTGSGFEQAFGARSLVPIAR